MKEIIEKAIEGGWGGGLKSDVIIEIFDETKTVGFHYPGKTHGVEMSIYDLLLQPLFWQSLGKALGWNELDMFCACDVCYADTCEMQGWLVKMHRFIDHTAKGKDPEEFFKDLITNH